MNLIENFFEEQVMLTKSVIQEGRIGLNPFELIRKLKQEDRIKMRLMMRLSAATSEKELLAIGKRIDRAKAISKGIRKQFFAQIGVGITTVIGMGVGAKAFLKRKLEKKE